MEQKEYKELIKHLQDDLVIISKGKFWFMFGGVVFAIISTFTINFITISKFISGTAIAEATKKVEGYKEASRLSSITIEDIKHKYAPELRKIQMLEKQVKEFEHFVQVANCKEGDFHESIEIVIKDVRIITGKFYVKDHSKNRTIKFNESFKNTPYVTATAIGTSEESRRMVTIFNLEKDKFSISVSNDLNKQLLVGAWINYTAIGVRKD